jgi:ketosteroid isomerase-like protein
MKLPILLAVPVLALMSFLSAQAASQDEAVLQTERDLAVAYQSSDADGIARRVMENYTLTDSRGQITTRANDLEEAKKKDPKYEVFENHDMKVRVHGDSAVVLGITHAKGMSGGKPFDAQFEFTDTFVNDNGRWRLFVPGNQEPWKKYYADDCIFADEKGRLMDKAKLIADVTPMPAGYSGSIKIENAQSRILSDTAILSYDADETETIFGQHLSARYHTTDTWIRRNGD